MLNEFCGSFPFEKLNATITIFQYLFILKLTKFLLNTSIHSDR